MTGPSDPTLCGVATGTPDGGVAIIRLSGPRSREIAEEVVGSLPVARRLSGRTIDLGRGQAEQGLVVWMPGPASFTGEDVVELQVHAGTRNVRSILEVLLEAGAVAAGPGAFSRRAFDRGRLDLSQAEGIAAIVGADTEAGLDQARRLAGGELGHAVEKLRVRVFGVRTEIEASLDFPEHVETEGGARWQGEVRGVTRELEDWLDRFEGGRRARERPRVVLAGPPNAGKSALLNALVGHKRAIVAVDPGTTRDYLEVECVVGGQEITLVDTAGQRPVAEGVEAEGVKRARSQMAAGDVVVWVVGSDQEQLERDEVDAQLRLEAKRDLGARRAHWRGVSARTGDGVAERGAGIGEAGAGRPGGWIGWVRHRDLAREALVALEDGARLLAASGGLELVAFQLGVVEDRLGAIDGRSRTGPVGADVLAEIFSRFCVGK